MQPASPSASAPAGRPAGETAPSATASAFVYAPQQAVSAPAGAIPPAAPPRPVVPPAPPGSAPTNAPAPRAPLPGGPLQLVVVPSSQTVAPGAIVTIDVMASTSSAVVDAPFHLTYDPNVVAFVDGAPGDFLTQGGSSIVFFADGQSRPGDVAVAAGRVERGLGASGAGLLCRVRLRGVAQGSTAVVVGQAKAWVASGAELSVQSSGTTVVVP